MTLERHHRATRQRHHPRRRIHHHLQQQHPCSHVRVGHVCLPRGRCPPALPPPNTQEQSGAETRRSSQVPLVKSSGVRCRFQRHRFFFRTKLCGGWHLCHASPPQAHSGIRFLATDSNAQQYALATACNVRACQQLPLSEPPDECFGNSIRRALSSSSHVAVLSIRISPTSPSFKVLDPLSRQESCGRGGGADRERGGSFT